LKITFLGTGTSQGVPVIACNCRVCTSTDPKDKRLRSSVLIEDEHTSVVVDSGPDFRQQLLRENAQRLDAVVFTHGHKDHTAGMDDVRAFNYKQQRAMDIYANVHTQEILKREFAYVFGERNYPGLPELTMHTIDGKHAFSIGTLSFQPFEVLHYRLPVLGFRVGDFTYITDANFISDESMEKIKGSNVVVLNALRREPHVSHFTLDEAVAMAEKIGAEKTYFTHLSHQMGLHDELAAELPPHIQPAYDGLQIVL
jgi:phosphoribosyl 1,2-cyclic phosphate phosphodiesterase